MSTENTEFLYLGMKALEDLHGLLKQKEAENEALKRFAREVIQAMREGGIDGFGIQELAVKHGLIEAAVATEADAEASDFVTRGNEIFRFVEWMHVKEPEEG